MKKFILATVLATVSSNAIALDIPKAQVNSTYDRVRTSTGAECQTSLDTGRYLNAGFYAKEEPQGTDFGVYIDIMRLQQQMLAEQAKAATVDTAGEDW